MGSVDLIDVTFRDAEARDLPKILELHAVTWDIHRTHYPEDFEVARWASTVEELKSRFEEKVQTGYTPITLVAEIEGDFAGYVTAIRSLDQRDEDLHEVVAHIDDISVLPAFRRKGIGAQLLARMKERLSAEGASIVKATVWSFNADSQRLFQRAGLNAKCTLVWERLSAPRASANKDSMADKTPGGRTSKPGDLALFGILVVLAVLLLSQLS